MTQNSSKNFKVFSDRQLHIIFKTDLKMCILDKFVLSKFPCTLQRALPAKVFKPIMNCHANLKMGSHDLSSHTFRSGLRFWKWPQKGVLKKQNLDFYSASTTFCKIFKTKKN